jgi:protein phosphatase
MLHVVDSAGQTHTGHVRQSNEDSLLMRGPLFVIADGMGGAAAGEIASRMCAEAFAEVDLIRRRGVDLLRDTATRANQRIHERAAADPALSGMGTTLDAALVGPDGRIAFSHVGDSRAYLLRDGSLQRLTEDHSIVGELVAAGQISEEEAANHPQRNVITRVRGAEPTVEVDAFELTARDGDIVLLCSDGLTGMVNEERIAEILGEERSCEEIVRRLIRTALAAGGEDNITAVAFRMGDGDEDTGSITRRILTVDPDLVPEDEEERPVNRRKLLLIAAAIVIVVAALGAGAVIGLRESHFIGADEATGRVEIYQGVPVELFAGIKLYHPVYDSPVMYASLDPQTRKKLFDHELRSYDGALAAVRQIEQASP